MTCFSCIYCIYSSPFILHIFISILFYFYNPDYLYDLLKPHYTCSCQLFSFPHSVSSHEVTGSNLVCNTCFTYNPPPSPIMGCTIHIWRCAIGCFYGKSHGFLIRYSKSDKYRSTTETVLLILSTFVMVQYLSVIQWSNPEINVLFIVMLLLMIYGDVHSNLGPNSNYSSNSDSYQSYLSVMYLNLRSLRNKLCFLEF